MAASGEFLMAVDMSVGESFRALVSDLDYPMFIVTVAAQGDRAGCLVGFVTQVSIDPPRLLVMLSTSNRAYRLAQAADTLVVHFLHETTKTWRASVARRQGKTSSSFDDCEWSDGPRGDPILIVLTASVPEG